MTDQKVPKKLRDELFDLIEQATVAGKFASLTGNELLKRYTVVRRHGGNLYRTVIAAAGIDKAYEQALTLPVSAFKEGDPIYAAALANMNEGHNVVVFDHSAEQSIPKGEWSLSVMIPKNEGAQLASELGLTAEEQGLRVGGYMFDFNVSDFTIAKAKAMRAVAWLSGRGYETQTSWGDIDLPLDVIDEETMRALNETGRCFYETYTSSYNRNKIPPAIVMLCDKSQVEPDQWASRLKRLRLRLAGSAEETSVKLTCAQVKALLDLTGEFATEYSFFSQSIEDDVQGYYHVSNRDWELFKDANQVRDDLFKILDELRNALRIAPTRTGFRGANGTGA
jgi:hypothetical protein